MLGFLLGFFLVGWGGEVYAQPARDDLRLQLRRQAEQIHKKGQYPAELPHRSIKPPEESWLQKLLRRWFEGDGKSSPFGPKNSILAEGLQLLLWGILGVILLLSLYLLTRLLQDSREEYKAQQEEREAEVEFMGLRLPSLDVEELVRQGRLDIALCVLLLEGMKRVGWRDDRLGKSQTAREVLHQIGFQDTRRTPYRSLLSLVERVRFGGEKATMAMLEEAKASLTQIPPLARSAPKEEPVA
jgi:hypothetical protein